MRIHANTLTAENIRAAAVVAKADVTVLDSKGSRSRSHAFEVKLGGDSPYRPMGGSYGDEYAASWDQWGIFLAALFAMDASTATGAYPTAEHFHIVTGDRFETVNAHGVADYETRHKWIPNGDSTQSCKRCSATFDWSMPTPKIERHEPKTYAELYAEEWAPREDIDRERAENDAMAMEASLW